MGGGRVVKERLDRLGLDGRNGPFTPTQRNQRRPLAPPPSCQVHVLTRSVHAWSLWRIINFLPIASPRP